MITFWVKDEMNDVDVESDLCKTHSCKAPVCSQQNPSSFLNSDVSIEGFFIELNLRKKKWLLCCSYNPRKNQTSNHLKEIWGNIDAFSSNFDNLILLVNFNVEPIEKHMKDFSLIYNCKNIIRYKTCYKNPESV